MTLRTRIAAVASLSVALAVLAAAIGLYVAVSSELRGQIDSALRARVQTLVAHAGAGATPEGGGLPGGGAPGGAYGGPPGNAAQARRGDQRTAFPAESNRSRSARRRGTCRSSPLRGTCSSPAARGRRRARSR